MDWVGDDDVDEFSIRTPSALQWHAVMYVMLRAESFLIVYKQTSLDLCTYITLRSLRGGIFFAMSSLDVCIIALMNPIYKSTQSGSLDKLKQPLVRDHLQLFRFSNVSAIPRLL